MQQREGSIFRTFRVGLSIFMGGATIGVGALAIYLFRAGQPRLALGGLFMLAVCAIQAWRFWNGLGDMMDNSRHHMEQMQEYIDTYHTGELPPSPPQSISRIESLRQAIYNPPENDEQN